MLYLDFAGSVIDLFVLKFYLDISLKKRKDINIFLYYLCFVLVETVLEINTLIWNNTYSTARTITKLIISFLTTLFVSFLYNSDIKAKIYVTLSFLLISLIGEFAANTIIYGIIVNEAESSSTAEYLIVFASKLIMLILVILSRLFWNKNNIDRGLNHILSQLVIPLLSLTIIFCFPPSIVTDDKYASYFGLFTVFLCVISIYSFFLLGQGSQIEALKKETEMAKNQLNYQTSKYNQLSTSYRDTRRLIHDTKNHYIYVSEAIKNNDIEKLPTYLNTALSSLENNYVRINTGNLVIDSLTGNLINMCEIEDIYIETDININREHILLDDYDLCVILGNLFDNAFNATKNLPKNNERKIIVKIQTTERDFIIKISNDFISSHNKNDINHGYGINNVINTTEKYKGLFASNNSENIYNSIVIIPLLGNENGGNAHESD